mmetsp:Transcript_137578/g.343313  ORF Transcript_137578/g.343313 Transcript_137578/m.343313 type:complete len:718 (+) Transcript_137578:69-2222(+)
MMPKAVVMPHGLVVFVISTALALDFAHATSVANVKRSSVTPVQKVVELLKKLRDTVQQEGMEEAANYDKFACFCREQSSHKVYALKKAGVKIEGLQSAVDSLGAEITLLDDDVLALKSDVQTEESGANESATARQETFSKYVEKRKNLTEGVDAITQALEALRSSRDSVGQVKVAAMLARRQALLIAVGRRSLVSENQLMKQLPPDYQYHARDIIATLQELLNTFKSQLADFDSEEAADRHQYEMAEGARANKIKALKAGISKKETLSAKKGEEKSEKQGLLDAEVIAKNQDQAFLDELTTTCEAKAKAWDTRSKTRASELTVLTDAMEQLDGMEDLYGVNTKLVGFVSRERIIGKVQPHTVAKAAVLLQLRRVVDGTVRRRPSSLVSFLESRAQVLGSDALAQVVASLQQERLAKDPEELGGTDHFTRVRGIIKDLITQLEDEAASEATSKTFCDTEMAAAVSGRDAQKAELESLAASLEGNHVEVEQLEAAIEQLNKDIADLYKALKEMADVRQEEQKANNNTIIDSDAGAQAVRQAIVVLKNFYDQPADLLQKGRVAYHPSGGDRDGNTVADLAPETFSGEYGGKITESKGVIGLLEIIQSDFERTSSTTATLEADQEEEYQRQKGATDEDIEQKEDQRSTAETNIETLENEIIGWEDEERDAQHLYEAALEKLEELKQDCVDSSESYAERRKKRQAEIEALREAMKILDEWQG